MGAGYGEDPMMAQCFKQMAKLQSVSASKPLPKKIEEAKKQKDLTSVSGAHGQTLDEFDAQLGCVLAGQGEVHHRAVARFAMLGVFWLELYIDKYVGRGLPPVWDQKMIYDAQKAHGRLLRGGGGRRRPEARSGRRR